MPMVNRWGEIEGAEEEEQAEPVPNRTVQVCEDVYQVIFNHIKDDEDFNTALRRFLFGEEKLGPMPWDRPVCPATPRYWGLTAAQLEVPLLQALQQLGGEGSRQDIETIVENSGILSEDDEIVTRNNRVLWKNRLMYARRRLVRDGYMSPTRGVWEITGKGQAQLAYEREFPTPIPPPEPHEPVRFYN